MLLKYSMLLIIVGYVLTFAENTSEDTAVNQKSTTSQVSSKTISASMELPSGVLFGTFSKEDGPFLIKGSVIVPSGQILEFAPGCTVYVGGEYSTITVFGQLFARGSIEEPVIFMSAKINPQPWDWDRIYCRSRNRSLFEHCIIRHSNYGIYVENGSVGVNSCRFEKNSLHGLVIKNSDVTLTSSLFTKGHVLAINLLHGAILTADSLVVRDNITGISCSQNTHLKITGGSIINNTNGILTEKESSVEIVGAEITRNKTGVITTAEIPRKMREMVYSNALDVKVTTKEKIEQLIKEPQPVTSIVVPATSPSPTSVSDFKAGFSALNKPQEPTASFIGNVTTGFSFFRPKSVNHPLDKDTSESYHTQNDGTIDTSRTITRVMQRQTKYPGEQSDKWFSGIQPELQFFANGRRGNADINLLMDLYGNQWLSTTSYIGKNMFNLSMNYSHQSLVIGDFFESTSETSIPGRQITGIRYTGKFLEMGRGEKRIRFKLAAGETEVAKDSGYHEVFVYNQTVDTGMSKRQQLTYLAELSYRPTRFSSLSARGIISHDQMDKPLFRKPLTDPAAVDPVSAQTGCISGNVFLFDRKFELFGEIDLGSADTITDSAAEEIAWYNPQINKAVPAVFSLFNKDDFQNHFAAIVGLRGMVKDYITNIKYSQIAPMYYSAGDPYLVNWRKNCVASIQKPLLSNLDLTGSYEFDRTTLQGFGEGNPPTVTDLNIFSLNAVYELGGVLPTFSLDYTLQHKLNDARESVVREDTSFSAAYDDKEFSNRLSIEGKQTFKNGSAYSIRYQLLHDNDYSNHPDNNLNDEGDRFHNAVSGWVTLKLKKRIRNKTSFRIAFKNENRDSLRAHQIRVTDQLAVKIIPRKLNATVSGEYMFKSEKEYDVSEWQLPLLTKYYSAELELKYSLTSQISCSVMGKYEKSFDELPGSSENYSAIISGLHFTYLF